MPNDIFHNLNNKLVGQAFTDNENLKEDYETAKVAACPDGKGFKARFSDFKVKHLPDQRRVDWLKNNQ